MKVLSTLLAFNRGLVSKLALTRLDLKRLGLSAETMTNWIPRLLGSMMLRPGTTHIFSTKGDAAARLIPFVYSTDDTAVIEATDSALRFIVDDVLLERTAVSTTLPLLDTWTDTSDVGATVGFVSTPPTAAAELRGTGDAAARIQVSVSIAVPPAVGVEHGLRVVIDRGTARITVLRSAAPFTNYLDVTLGAGTHSIAFTPLAPATGIYVRAESSEVEYCYISDISIEAAGVVELPSPWLAANLQNIRTDQSGDVVFAACEGVQPRRIARQAARSWSCEKYVSDGPYRDENVTQTTMTPNALSGSITLTASTNYFTAGNVGSIFRLEHLGQNVVDSLTSLNDTIEPIRVNGVLDARLFAISVTGFGTATVTLQRSIGEPGSWTDVESYTANTTKTYNDGLDNQIVYYRLTATAYTSGTITAELAYDSGSSRGRALVTSYTSPTAVTAYVIDAFGSLEATDTWWESAWSDRRGWPSAVALHDGRLWWASNNRVSGSVSDDYTNFDDAEEGDSGPILRTIAMGPVDRINWILSLEQLIFGTEGAELPAKSSSFDEPLTPTAFSLKASSTIGSDAVEAVQVDSSGMYVARNGGRLMELAPDGARYVSQDLTSLNPGLFESPIVRLAAQRFPDTRLHAVRADGKVGILLFDKLEQANCWVLYETDGVVEDVCVLPGTPEDTVYYVVKRTINSVTKRYLEKWNLESEGTGAAITKLADCGLIYSGASTTAMSGLSHLEGKTVCVWGNTKDLGTYTVASGAITLTEAVTWAFIGLPYTADYKTARLALASTTGNPLTQKKRLDHLGLILADVHAQGLQYGSSFDYLDDMPLMEQGAAVDGDAIRVTYDETSFEVNGVWETDSRLCLRAQAPRPVTVLAAVVGIAGHDKV